VTASHEITQWLMRWSDGQQDAECEVMRLVMPELRRHARRFFRRERRNHTLQPTALINEAYIRLVNVENARWQDRWHFFAMSATIMRHILVDYARHRIRAGGDAIRITLDDSIPCNSGASAEVIELNDALDALAKFAPRQAAVVELKFFGGMSGDEVAAVLGVSPGTIDGDWKLARAWLLREMSAGSIS